MARKTKQNDITSPELIAQINPENIRLLEDFITYLKSIQRSENTLKGYLNDLHIFMVWNLQNNKNKLFTELSKRDSYEVSFNVTESVRVNHSLNRYPSVVVMDSSNRQIVTMVTYIDRNTVVVSWTGETSGKIVCN